MNLSSFWAEVSLPLLRTDDVAEAGLSDDGRGGNVVAAELIRFRPATEEPLMP